jgi:N-acetylglutamate synthase-like GNAT family acetyltransferase
MSTCHHALVSWLLSFDFGGLNPKFGGVSSSNYRVRRATLDDIGQLTALWDSMQYPTPELARRVTDFQVAEAPDGKVIGALALQITERQGRVHSESFSDFALSEYLRPLLWDRVHAVATNHGLLRLWTQEQAPFWNHCGLLKADAEALQKLPAPWRGTTGAWLTLKLKEDVETLVSLDKEFAMFMESEKQRTERVFQHARTLKTIATVIAVMLLAAVLVWGVSLVLHNPQLFHR